MRKRISHWVAVLVTVWSLDARADCSGLVYFAEAWLQFGPTISPMLALKNEANRLRPGPVLRLGMFAGLPVQLEATVGGDLIADPHSPTLEAGVGMRLLPVSLSANGVTRGGLPGHNLGVIAGYANLGWYLGAVYEWLVLPEVGVVAELQWSFGGILREPPAFHLGAKFQIPAFGDL